MSNSQDIDTLLAQLDEIKKLPLDEQEAWVKANLEPVAAAFDSFAVTFQEAVDAIWQSWKPFAEWYGKNERTIEWIREQE